LSNPRDSAVRPIGEMLGGEEECVECGREEETVEEGRTIRGQSKIVKPSQQECDDHMRTHIPYRKWCDHCVRGKRKRGGRTDKEYDIKENEEVPRIAFDYMKQKSKEIREEEKKEKIARGKSGNKEEEIEEDYLPTLVPFESGVKWVSANVVPKKGVEGFAVQAVGREIDLAGLRRMIVRSDQEPALLELLRAVKAERPEDLEIQPEQSPVGESKSNGEIERAIQTVQGHVRTMKLSVQRRYSCNIREDHPIWPWLVMYAALLLNLCDVGEDGRTAYERRKGRKFKKVLPEFGECIRHLSPDSVGIDKAGSRWDNGIFVGLRIESGEIFVMTDKGVVKVRSYARKPEEERCEGKLLETGKGVPWEPIPGRGRIEVKTKVGVLQGMPRGDSCIDPENKDTVVKRVYITKKDVEHYKPPIGCRGCRAVTRGESGLPHNERCRERMEKEIEKNEPERTNKELERMSSRIEENLETKKRKTEDTEEEKQEDAMEEDKDGDCEWICNECGKPVQGNWKHCGNCGTELESVVDEDEKMEDQENKRKDREDDEDIQSKRQCVGSSSSSSSGSANKMNIEEADTDSWKKMMRTEGESQGDIAMIMNIDSTAAEDWEDEKQNLR
jgi:hypothetical protein